MQRPKVDVGCLPNLFYLIFQDKIVHGTWSSLFCLDCLANKPLGPTCLPLPSAGIAAMYFHT